jgi:hypothetical protein
MERIYSEGPASFTQPDEFKLRKLTVRLGNAYVRLGARDRNKVMRALEQFTFGTKSRVGYWDMWSKDELKCCYLQLKPISQKMAKDLRRWASKLLRLGHNNRLALKCLTDELDGREDH